MSESSEVIRSRTNPLIKGVAKALAGHDPSVIVLEGERLLDDAIEAGHELELVLLAERCWARAEHYAPASRLVRCVEDGLFERISSLDKAPGVMGICRTPAGVTLEDLDVSGDALLLVIAGVANPGNLGALLRSAEAAGVRAVILLAGGARPWNQKVVRGSMGSALRVPLVVGEQAASVAAALGARDVRQVVAATRGGASLASFDWSGAIALWVGHETGELPPVCAAFEPVTIAMAGAVESLNVSVAASLLLFAAGRTSAESRHA